jgi:signal transduction histidine kinase
MSSPVRIAGARMLRTGGDLIDPVRPWLPPLNRREFWAVQALVIVIAGGHDLLETLGRVVEPQALYLLPTSLFFVPVVYAALNFGWRGSMATALWCVFLTLPNIVFWHSGLERLGVIWQMGILVAVAAFVGQRVDRETRARREAEDRERERRNSEARYRGLFDNAADAILLLDTDAKIVEANAAAMELLGRSIDVLRGFPLSDVVGAGVADRLLHPGRLKAVALARPAGGRSTYVEPIICEPDAGPDGVFQTQLMLHDVTYQHERQRDLEAYARRTLAAREEEQRRIGREVHDGPLQNLVLLWRKLDTIDQSGGDGGAMVREARDLAEATADELRRISRALRPSVLDDLGVAAALKSEGTALAQRCGISVHFEQSGEEARLPAEIELTLLRVAQEALHNVERHAAAGKVVMRLVWESERVRLTVHDDGRGMESLPSASDLLEAGNLGIVGMQERARLVGGDFAVHLGPGQGTIVEVVVPTRPLESALDRWADLGTAPGTVRS